MTTQLASESEILAELEKITQDPSLVYTFALVTIGDLFFEQPQVADIDWSERLSFQELTLLAGVMAKHSIELSTIPTEEKESEQRHLLYDLFRQLHRVHSEPMFGTRLDPKPSESLADAERSFREAFSLGTLMVEPLFYSGSAAYDFQYLELAGTKYDQDHDWIVQNIGISIKQTARAATELKRLQTREVRSLLESTPFPAMCEAALATLTFVRKDLPFLTEKEFSAFIDAYSVAPGNAGHTLTSVGATNEVEFRPILVLDEDLFFMPIYFDLAKSIYESPFYWMAGDDSYQDAEFKHRGEAGPAIADAMLKGVFGGSRVYKMSRSCVVNRELLTLTCSPLLATEQSWFRQNQND